MRVEIKSSMILSNILTMLGEVYGKWNLVPYGKFENNQNIEFIAEGGFSKIHKLLGLLVNVNMSFSKNSIILKISLHEWSMYDFIY